MQQPSTTQGQTALGGWSPFAPPTPPELAVFEEATKGFVGVHYTPTEVSTQVVAGMNYQFRCKAEPAYPGALPFTAIVQIYQAPGNPPVITCITRTSWPPGSPGQNPDLDGGWSPFVPLNSEAREMFGVATKNLEGVHYEPRKVSEQIVAGTNYRYLCDAQTMSQERHPFQALVEIFKPLNGSPYITRIQTI